MKPESFLNFVAFQSLVLLFLVAAFLFWLRPTLWMHGLTTFVGALTGWLSLRTDEIVVIVFLLLAFGCFAGFMAGARAWQHAIILGIWVPMFAAFGHSAAPANVRPLTSPGIIMPFVFAFAGAYGGAFLMRLSPRRPVAV